MRYGTKPPPRDVAALVRDILARGPMSAAAFATEAQAARLTPREAFGTVATLLAIGAARITPDGSAVSLTSATETR
jgi:hypothetical protein